MMKEIIINTVKDSVRDLLYYKRKDDEDLKPGDIQDAVAKGIVTKDEIKQAFSDELDEYWDELIIIN